VPVTGLLSTVMPETRQAVIVGGGHNGLVAAFYLARAGLRPLVLERRPFVGGACNTEEFAPGFRASTGAYVLSMLREPIWQDMRLARRGLVVDPAGPSLNLFADGTTFMLDDDVGATQDEIRRFSKSDAAAFPAFEAELAGLAEAIRPMFDWTPPNPGLESATDLRRLMHLGARALRYRRRLLGAGYLFTTSVTQYLDEWFESDVLKAALGWHAINDSVAGPSTPGTAYVLLHDHAAEEAGGGVRSWGFVRGGMGVVTELMADAAREAGAEIRTDAEVEAVLAEGGRAVGVRLAGGEEVRAEAVLSNADPKRTFLTLCDPSDLPDSFLAAVRAYRCNGTSIKINLAVSELPRAAAMGGNGAVHPYHRGIVELSQPLLDMDRAQSLALRGIPADDPHVELCFPTVHDPSLAPPGCHVVTIDVNSQPYHLAEGGWDAIREAAADRAVAQIGALFPNLEGSILHRQVLSPLDLERVIGLTGGHALHGDMGADQLFSLRPVRGYADYRAPLRGLYLCGAGTHPGGGVTGANGRNCAREVVKDARVERIRRRARRTTASVMGKLST
jgi:phytoene dehydrogenase-like protein